MVEGRGNPDAAAEAGASLQVLVQGTHPKRSLLQRFLDTPGSVLVGSASFWEGIDVPGAALQCVLSGTALIEKRRLDDEYLSSRVLVGGRYMFSDESMISVEYLHQADGYTPTEFQDLVSVLDVVSQARKLGLPITGRAGGGSAGGHLVALLGTTGVFANLYAVLTGRASAIGRRIPNCTSGSSSSTRRREPAVSNPYPEPTTADLHVFAVDEPHTVRAARVRAGSIKVRK